MQPPVNKLRLLSLHLQRFNCVPNILEFTDNDTVIDVHLCDATWDIWMQSLVSHGSFCPPPFCAWCQTGVRPSCSNFCWQAPLPPSHKTVFTGTIRSIKHSHSTGNIFKIYSNKKPFPDCRKQVELNSWLKKKMNSLVYNIIYPVQLKTSWTLASFHAS